MEKGKVAGTSALRDAIRRATETVQDYLIEVVGAFLIAAGSIFLHQQELDEGTKLGFDLVFFFTYLAVVVVRWRTHAVKALLEDVLEKPPKRLSTADSLERLASTLKQAPTAEFVSGLASAVARVDEGVKALGVSYQGVPALMRRFLEANRRNVEDRARDMVSDHQLRWQPEDVFAHLMELMSLLQSNHQVRAVASRNLGWYSEGRPQAYLEENVRAVRDRRINIRRIFILSGDDEADQSIRALIRAHGRALADDRTGSGVKWLRESEAGPTLARRDFVLFGTEVLVRQEEIIPTIEMTVQSDIINESRDAFHQLWHHRSAKEVEELPNPDIA